MVHERFDVFSGADHSPICNAKLVFYKVLQLFTPFYVFVLIPVLEVLLPQDSTHLNEKERARKTQSRFFDWILYLNLLVVTGLLALFLWIKLHHFHKTYVLIGLDLSFAIVLGVNGMNVGHELGHRQNSWERFLGKALLLPSFYMHFYVEHNFGHHAHAATLEDTPNVFFYYEP